jgi:hypothetical protein
MKKLLSVALLFALCALFPARADECCQNTEATVQQRLREIDLNIALKKYEQIQNEAARAELQLVLLETDSDIPEEDRKAKWKNLNNRVEILRAHADQIRARALELSKAVTVAAK